MVYGSDVVYRAKMAVGEGDGLGMVIMRKYRASMRRRKETRQAELEKQSEMRRLSGFRSPKSLLDYIDVDQELYGYENEANVIDQLVDFDSSDVFVEPIPSVCNVESSCEQLEESGKSDSSSDDETTLPSPKSPQNRKHSLRRFLCMPMKSFRRKKSKGEGLLADEK